MDRKPNIPPIDTDLAAKETVQPRSARSPEVISSAKKIQRTPGGTTPVIAQNNPVESTQIEEIKDKVNETVAPANPSETLPEPKQPAEIIEEIKEMTATTDINETILEPINAQSKIAAAMSHSRSIDFVHGISSSEESMLKSSANTSANASKNNSSEAVDSSNRENKDASRKQSGINNAKTIALDKPSSIKSTTVPLTNINVQPKSNAVQSKSNTTQLKSPTVQSKQPSVSNTVIFKDAKAVEKSSVPENSSSQQNPSGTSRSNSTLQKSLGISQSTSSSNNRNTESGNPNSTRVPTSIRTNSKSKEKMNDRSKNQANKNPPVNSNNRSQSTEPFNTFNAGNLSPLRSLKDYDFRFNASSESVYDTAEESELTFFESLENLTSKTQYKTLKEFQQSVGTIFGEVTHFDHQRIVQYGGETLTSQRFKHDWPVPTSIEEVRRLCETELTSGTPQSQLALCLHLMESAVDPENNNNSLIEQSSSRFFEDIMASFGHNKVATTLGEALVYESKKLLKQLSRSGQAPGESADAEAQFILGNCYGMGALGWPVDPKRAFKCYAQASKSNHPEATYRTAVCFELGLGTEKHGQNAVLYYRKAAHLMHVPGMYKLGIILMEGYCGATVSKREATIWLQRAACIAIAPTTTPAPPSVKPGETSTTPTPTSGIRGGIALPHALHALGMLHMSKECEDTSLIADPVYAIKLFHNAARLGYAPSQWKLGEAYEKGEYVRESEKDSIYWYTLAASQDFPEACLRLSNWYLTGSLKTNVLPSDDEQAFKWAKKAAYLSKTIRAKELSAEIHYTLAVYYENGIGTEKSKEMAAKHFKKAAQNGHLKALKMKV
jgi:TPR repeat protein